MKILLRYKLIYQQGELAGNVNIPMSYCAHSGIDRIIWNAGYRRGQDIFTAQLKKELIIFLDEKYEKNKSK